MPKSATLAQPFTGLKSRSATLLRLYPRETIGFGLLALAAAVAVGGVAQSTPELPGGAVSACPSGAAADADPRSSRPTRRCKVNAEIPVDSGPNPAAQPFAFKGNAATRTQALSCLASAVYYEAGSQDDDGQRAVAQVVLNRVRHPAFPASVCGVVYEGSTRATGCQFTFTCDGSLYRQPDAAGWRRAYTVAEAGARRLRSTRRSACATHYHADYVVPYWASTLAKNAVVGAHIFYRWAGGWGQPAAFDEAYAGHEPNALALRNAALAAAARLHAQAETSPRRSASIPGAESLAPSMRGDKRVAVRFKLDRAQGIRRGAARGLSQEVRGVGQSQMDAVERHVVAKDRSRSARAPAAPAGTRRWRQALTGAASHGGATCGRRRRKRQLHRAGGCGRGAPSIAR